MAPQLAFVAKGELRSFISKKFLIQAAPVRPRTQAVPGCSPILCLTFDRS
jgi:hypothetical protein